MIREEDAPWLLEQLEQLAARLGVEVRYEYLGERDDGPSFRSGTCRVRGEPVVIIDRYRSPVERCRLLLCELQTYDLSKVFVSPAVRRLLDG